MWAGPRAARIEHKRRMRMVRSPQINATPDGTLREINAAMARQRGDATNEAKRRPFNNPRKELTT